MPRQERRHAVRVAHVDRDQPTPLRCIGTMPLRPGRLRARNTDQPVPSGIQTPARHAPIRGADERQIVVETDPRLWITGPASVRDGEHRRQSFDELVVISQSSTVVGRPGPYSAGPTGPHCGRDVPISDGRPSPPGR
jgi:hypothetical protein